MSDAVRETLALCLHAERVVNAQLRAEYETARRLLARLTLVVEPTSLGDRTVRAVSEPVIDDVERELVRDAQALTLNERGAEHGGF